MIPVSDIQGIPGERYVALGDSYTIGEGAEEAEAWPNLLTTHLRQHGVPIKLVANPSVSGWTTRHVIRQELPVLEASRPTFATLLIGVNDWIQGVTPHEFAGRLAQILDRIQATLPEPHKVLLITIPDFSITPEGPKYGNGRDIAQGIAIFNNVLRAEAARRALPLVDIYPLSRQLAGPEWIALDELHPSAAAYARWEEDIFPAALSLLTCRPADKSGCRPD